MTSEKLDEFSEDFAILIEAGFVAVKQLDETSATRIFKAAQVMSPKSVAPEIGLGYIALNKLELKEATKIFESVLEKEPENYLAKTFLGLSLMLTKPKREKGEQLIKEALEKSEDETVKSLCKMSLEWAEKDLKKTTKAPFFDENKSAPSA